MRNLLMVGVLFFAVAGSAMAQDYPKGEVGGNYTYIRLNPGGSNCQGGGGSAAWNLNHYFGIAGEFDACKVTGLSVGSAHALTYLFGPRLTYRTHGGLEPFAEALVGGARITASGGGASASLNSFAFAVGGGADYKFSRSITIRFIQADYLFTHFAGVKQNNARIQAGIVYRFGGR
jgi:opacity protein-like surface antigen